MKIPVNVPLVSIVSIALGCSSFVPEKTDVPPARPFVEREFRGVWVATVANIDWPTERGLSTAEQRREARAILDTAAALGFNAVILQVRPHCDAIYESSLEPWSAYLTGEQGRPPDPYYDPLAFWVEEAHDRGLALHAWFNPYRALLPNGGAPTTSSVLLQKPHLVKTLPNGTLWLDPSNPGTQEHSLNVVMDVVRRYDVDGIHFDDYFYPYGDGTFPDDSTWGAYTASGGEMSRNDWRRSHVNDFLRSVYHGIKREKPAVQFGLSPFGIWRPHYPPSISGFDQYDMLFADARLWLSEGWVDYFTPQLYWPVNQIPQSFPVLLGWWTRQNRANKHLWPGLFTSRLDQTLGFDELFNEIMITRGFVPESPGTIQFSMKVFMKDSTRMNDGLRNGPFRVQALVPQSPWLDDVPPAPPSVSSSQETSWVSIRWEHADRSDVFRWVVYVRYDDRWEYEIFGRLTDAVDVERTKIVQVPLRRPGMADSLTTQSLTLTGMAVSAVDRLGNESEKVFGNPGPGLP